MTNSYNNGAGAVCDPLAQAGEEPDIHALQQEYTNAWTQGRTQGDGQAAIGFAEDVRYTRWAGQTRDGLKHQDQMPNGKEARPYDGAPDCRVPLADETINALVDVLCAAFWGARANPKPTHATKMTAHQAGELRTVISWMLHGPLGAELIDDVEFAAQMTNTLGWCVLHPTWIKRHTMKMQKLSLEEIMQMSAGAPPESIMGNLPAMVMDPESEEAMVALLMQLFPGVDKAEGKRVITELRESEDHTAEFPVPVLAENRPKLEVLIPHIDLICPVEMTKLQKARVLFHRIFMSEAELEATATDEEWDPDFVTEVKKTAGLVSDKAQSQETQQDINNRQIEILVSYARQVKDGVPGIYCTVFSPNLAVAPTGPQKTAGGESRGKQVFTETQLYAKHFLLDFAHGEYPFLDMKTEVIGKRPDDARGVPEILATAQLEYKRQRDALFVHTELSITPPLKKLGTKASKLPPEFGPLAVFNFGGSMNDWEWFNPPPGKPELAFQLIENIRKERDEYHGLARPDTHPQRAQARQQRMTDRWLMTWGVGIWHWSVLAYQNLSTDELTALLGRPPLLTVDDLLKYRVSLWFDVRSLDNQWVKDMTQQITEILATDTGGTVDRSKLTQIMLAYLDPTLADEVSLDQQGAAKAIFNDVRSEVAQVMLGNEAEYVENDPTAKMKLQFLQQIISSNPNYVMVLHPSSPQFNARTAELLQKYAASLQQSATQQDNKVVGRIGVKPMAMDTKAGS